MIRETFQKSVNDWIWGDLVGTSDIHCERGTGRGTGLEKVVNLV